MADEVIQVIKPFDFTNEASENDLDSNHVLWLDSKLKSKRLLANKLAKRSSLESVAKSIAKKFDPSRTQNNPYLAGDGVMYNDELYKFSASHYGPWTGTDVEKTTAIDFLTAVNVVEAVNNWLEEHPEATTTVEDESITEQKLNPSLISSRTPYKYLNGVSIVSLDDGNIVYTDCTINSMVTGGITERFTGTHIFRNCTIGVLDVIGLYDGHFEFINCSFSYIRVNATKCIFKNCVGDHIALVGDCSQSLIEGCTLTALLGKGCFVINGANAAQNITIRNCRLTNKQDPATLENSIDSNCINTHGVSNSIIEGNVCEAYDANTNAIEVNGHDSSDVFRSYDNVVRDNNVKVGVITVFGTKDVIVKNNQCDSIKMDGGFRDNLDYGTWLFTGNDVRYTFWFRASSGSPMLKIIISGNVIHNKGNTNAGAIQTNYDFDATKINIEFVNNTLFKYAISMSNTYGKKVRLPLKQVFLQPGETVVLPYIYCFESNGIATTGALYNNPDNSFTNSTDGVRYIAYCECRASGRDTVDSANMMWSQ